MTFLVSHFSQYASQIQTSLSNALHKCSEETNFWSAKPWQFIWNDKSGKESYFYLKFSPQPGLVPLSLPRPLVPPHRRAACGPPSPFPLSCCPLLRAPLSGAAISREVRPLPPSVPGNRKAWPAGMLSLIIIWLCVKVKKLYWLGCIFWFFQVEKSIRLVSAHASAGYQQQKQYAWGGSPLCLTGCGPNRLILASLSLVWGGCCLPTSCHRVRFSFSFHELLGCVKEGRWAPACSSGDGVQNGPVLMRQSQLPEGWGQASGFTPFCAIHEWPGFQKCCVTSVEGHKYLAPPSGLAVMLRGESRAEGKAWDVVAQPVAAHGSELAEVLIPVPCCWRALPVSGDFYYWPAGKIIIKKPK